MSTCENLTFVDPQAELRARYLAAWRAHLKACAKARAAGLWEYGPGWPRFDLAPFFELRCGAKGKRTGRPCPHTAIYGNGRCKWHGGLSTGPKTPEGRAKAGRNGPGKAGSP